MSFSFNKEKKIYFKSKDFQVSWKSLQIIEIILSEFTPEQLKFLELSFKNKTQTFRERMIVEYGHMHTKCIKEGIVNWTKLTINNHKDKFDSKISSCELSDLFVNQFSIFFK